MAESRSRNGDNRIPAKRFKNKLLEKGMSLQEVSELTGVSLSTLRNFYYGRSYINLAKIEVICKIADVLGCSEKDILEPF